MVSCQKGPTRHAYAWQMGPFWQDTLEFIIGLSKSLRGREALAGRGPTGLRARVRNRGRLENRSHTVPKTGFQDGGDRTRIFTHKIIILA